MVLKNNLLLLLALALFLSGLLAFGFVQEKKEAIVLKDSGFYPKSIAVESGSTVTFRNKSSHVFWPASDNHPTHDFYTEFDTGRPIGVGESWEFTFDKDGVWWFHDHLRPYFRGKVVVGDVDESVGCLDIPREETNVSERQACWERELANILEEEGVKQSFELFSELYNSDPDFTSVGCHWMAHKIGEAEYGVYLQHKDISQLEFPPETVYCGYGYYHGFLEHFLRDDPDYDVAERFCQNLIRDLEDEVPRIRLNCYHAIGHGFVPEPIDIEVWGNAPKMVAPALTACRNIEEKDARVECLQGTFNVIADWMWNNQFGLYYPEDTPLDICESFDDYEASSSCYYEVSMRLNPSVDNDIARAYDKYISKIPDEFIAGTVLNSFAASVLGQRILEDDFSDLVYECRNIPEKFQIECMKGLTGAFVAHGEPEKEYVKAINFCSMNFLTSVEKDTCYWNVIRTFRGAYTKDKMVQVCALVEEPYQKYCAPDYVYE